MKVAIVERSSCWKSFCFLSFYIYLFCRGVCNTNSLPLQSSQATKSGAHAVGNRRRSSPEWQPLVHEQFVASEIRVEQTGGHGVAVGGWCCWLGHGERQQDRKLGVVWVSVCGGGTSRWLRVAEL